MVANNTAVSIALLSSQKGFGRGSGPEPGPDLRDARSALLTLGPNGNTEHNLTTVPATYVI